MQIFCCAAARAAGLSRAPDGAKESSNLHQKHPYCSVKKVATYIGNIHIVAETNHICVYDSKDDVRHVEENCKGRNVEGHPLILVEVLFPGVKEKLIAVEIFHTFWYKIN